METNSEEEYNLLKIEAIYAINSKALFWNPQPGIQMKILNELL